MVSKKSASAKKSPSTAAKKHTTKVTTVEAAASESLAPTSLKARTPLHKSSVQSGDNRSFAFSALVAEFIGTFVLASAVVLTKGEPLYVGISLVAIVLMIGALSGSHVNPLITVGAWATRKIGSKRAAGYIIAQVLGAMLALVVLTAFSGAAPKADPQAAMFQQQATATLFKANAVADSKAWFVFFSEMLGATIFGFAVSSAMREIRDRTAQAFTVGFGLLVSVVIAGVAASYASASAVVNPAVAIAVRAIELPGNTAAWWALLIYAVAPIIGGTLGFFLYDLLRGGSSVKE